jgi:hypothetical protein
LNGKRRRNAATVFGARNKDGWAAIEWQSAESSCMAIVSL